jgi:acetyl esterase/lipase
MKQSQFCNTLAAGILAMPLGLVQPAIAADKVRVEKDVAYLGPDRQEKGDLYLPAATVNDARFPAVVLVHGGGWFSGDKGSQREIATGTTLAENGFAAFSINYVLAAKGRPVWPQNLYDVKTAIRWLRKNADRLHVDPNRIGVMGASAGGHLAAMAAVTGPESGLDPPGPYGEYSCRVQAAIDFYGPIDLTTWSLKRFPELHPDLAMLPGTRVKNPEVYKLASPTTHVDKNDPPMLIVHGAADDLVSVGESQRFAEVLKRAGAPHQLVIVAGGGHSFGLQPPQQDLRPVVLDFLEQNLKKQSSSPKATSGQ